ncbi:MAG: hypothetical protein ACPG52_07790 [Cognaticolwellia sp.]
MRELKVNEIEQVNGGGAKELAIGGLSLAGGLNSTVAGYAAAAAWGGPVGWAVGLGAAAVYGGMALFVAYSVE